MMIRRLKPSPTHSEYRVLRELARSYGMTPSQLSVKMGIGSNRSSKACKGLLRLKLIEPNGIIDRFESQLTINDEGRQMLRLIEDWHNQSWFKRLTSEPP